MKILHTADWHCGKTLRGRSRASEHRAVLAEIAALARGEAVDLILVTGDLFDSQQPSPEAEEIVYGALLALGGVAPVVAVGGNHDNERRLAAVAPLLALGRVTMQSTIARPEDGGVVEVTASGETARIALLPWLSQRHIVKAEELMTQDAADNTAQFAERLTRIIGRLTGSFEAATINIIAGHVTIAGGVHGGGERTAQTIFEYWIDAAAFPATAHYVALGHLHAAQSLPGPCPIHYCGSPLQLDFSDTEGAKSVLVVEASPSTPAVVRPVELESGRRLRTLTGTLDELRPLAGTTGDDYLRIRLTESARVGLNDETRALFPDAVDVIVQGTPGFERPPRRLDSGRAPRALFADYLAEKNASDPELMALFDRLYEEVHAASPA